MGALLRRPSRHPQPRAARRFTPSLAALGLAAAVCSAGCSSTLDEAMIGTSRRGTRVAFVAMHHVPEHCRPAAVQLRDALAALAADGSIHIGSSRDGRHVWAHAQDQDGHRSTVHLWPHWQSGAEAVTHSGTRPRGMGDVHIAIRNESGGDSIVDLRTGAEVARLEGAMGYRTLAIAPDEHAAWIERSSLRMAPLRRPDEQHAITSVPLALERSEWCGPLAWTESGEFLAIGISDDRARIARIIVADRAGRWVAVPGRVADARSIVSIGQSSFLFIALEGTSRMTLCTLTIEAGPSVHVHASRAIGTWRWDSRPSPSGRCVMWTQLGRLGYPLGGTRLRVGPSPLHPQSAHPCPTPPDADSATWISFQPASDDVDASPSP